MADDPREAVLTRYASRSYLAVGPDVNGTTHPDTARTYLADGRGLAWKPVVPSGLSFAIDAEIASQPVSPVLARRARSSDPAVVWPLWTGCEAAAKALDRPVLSWLSWPGLQLPDDVAEQVRLRWVRFDDVVVCFGVASPGACCPSD